MKIANNISLPRLTILILSFTSFISAQMRWSSWSRYSVCSVTCGKGRQRRQRQCIKASSSTASSCIGPKEMYAPCQMLACPEKTSLPCNCGCTLQGSYGQILSQLPSRETKNCEWKIVVRKGSKIELNVTRLILKAGWVRIASGNKPLLTLLKPGPEPAYPWSYRSDSNVMTLELLSYPDASGQILTNTYLAAEYSEKKAPVKKTSTGKSADAHKNNKNTKSPNVTAIIGITACVVVIVLVAVFLAVRKHRKNKEESEEEENNDAVTYHSDFDGNAKTRCNAGKEEKPLMDVRSDRYVPSQQSMIMRPNLIQTRDSAYESEKCLHSTQAANGLARPRYPQDYYIKTPTYVHDPNFVRMVPVTTTSGSISMQPVMQPILMPNQRIET